MKIVCDENITFAKEAFSSFGNLALLPGREITNKHLTDADVLIVRSVTEVNEALLKGTKVKFVGTATIGTDHLDKNYLSDNGITFASAPGCNSFAVSEWVITAVLELISKFELNPKTAAVIGHGNIGSKVTKILSALGLTVKVVDPPKAEIENRTDFYSIDEVLGCDILTFHTPIIKSGKYPTYHLMNEDRLSKLSTNAILLNSSRGAVVDNKALLKVLSNKCIFTAFDVFENEPVMDLDLLCKLNIATPHIAGYSLEGKVNGTKMIYDQICDFLNVDKTWEPDLPKLDSNLLSPLDSSAYKLLNDIIQRMYPIKNDDAALRTNPNSFDLLRKNYKARREFNNYSIAGISVPKKLHPFLNALRINII